MKNVWKSNASGTAPPTPGSFSNGYPTEGNLGLSIPPTNPGAWWFHMITQELLAVITAAGITPDGTNLTQLLAALDARYGAASLHVSDFTGSNQLLTANGYQKLPGGLIVQWGAFHVGDFSSVSNASGSLTFPISFPNACLRVLPSLEDATGNAGSVAATAKSTSGFSWCLAEPFGIVQDTTVVYLAIGN